MLEDTLKLDYAGIICLEKETETEYIRRGNNVLEQADKIKDDFDLVYRNTGKMPKKRIEFPAVVSECMEQGFGVNPSWIPLYKMKFSFKRFGYCTSIYSDKISVPVIFYNNLLCNGYITMHHEALHAVRKFVNPSMFTAFEEAFASYGQILPDSGLKNVFSSLNCSRTIRKARKRLEDKFGDKAGHMLIRLLPPEIYAIASSKEPEILLKDWGCMRHEIIRERLGL